MSDLGDLLRGRFDGHEVPVDPAVWEAVRARLGAAAPATAPEDGLNDLFRTRFKDHEVHVDPAVWNAVRGRIGTPGATGVTWAGRIAAVVGTAALVAGALWLLREDAPQPTPQPTPAVTPVPGTAPEEEAIQHATGPIAAVPADAPPTDAPRPEATAGAQDEADRSERAAQDVPRRMEPVVHELTEDAAADVPRTPLGPAPGVDAAPLATLPPAAPEGKAVVEKVIEDLARTAEQEARQDAARPQPRWPEEMAPDDVPADALPELYLPSTFTPNGDGVNDTYQVVGEGFEHVRVRVYAIRTNQLVFATNSGEAWDGAGSPDGHYVVAVEAIAPDGRIVTESKVVWLTSAH